MSYLIDECSAVFIVVVSVFVVSRTPGEPQVGECNDHSASVMGVHSQHRHIWLPQHHFPDCRDSHNCQVCLCVCAYVHMHACVCVTELAVSLSCGGNIAMNIGPTHDGRIMPIFKERFNQTGEHTHTHTHARAHTHSHTLLCGCGQFWLS